MEESRWDSGEEGQTLWKSFCFVHLSWRSIQWWVSIWSILKVFTNFCWKQCHDKSWFIQQSSFLQWCISRNCIGNRLEGAQVHWLFTKTLRAHSLGKSTNDRALNWSLCLRWGLSENGMFKFFNPNQIRLPMKSLKIGHITVLLVHDLLTVLLLIYEKKNFFFLILNHKFKVRNVADDPFPPSRCDLLA